MSTTDNINGIYAKDTELRNRISELRGDILSQTIKPLNITENGTYTSDPTVGAYGYSPITVDVQEQPWQPLQDGYSNFWFELTNDTLSPWLNFSAKTESAVIDWGDGSGEQALTTLTPTHTYSKAGKYVVKVKGVTGIARQFSSPYKGKYLLVLNYIELNSDVTSISPYGFYRVVGLQGVSGTPQTIGNDAFNAAYSLNDIRITGIINMANFLYAYTFCLEEYTIPNTVTTIGVSSMQYCIALTKVTIPNTVTSVGDRAFAYCASLQEIHVQATTPPTFGNEVFYGSHTNFIIYVPVGYGDTYKSASGWSSYADHILEEGQQPNRAMLAKFNSDNTDNEEMR